MKTDYVVTIKAQDRPGLLHLVTGILNRKLIPIISLNAAPTDVHDIVSITMEISISEKALQPLLYKLENIIEVFSLEAVRYDQAISLRSAFFKMDKAVLASQQVSAIRKWEAQMVSLYPDSVLIAKSGNEEVIRSLYNDLDGPYLLGFSQTGLITDSKLIGEDQSSVINWLAA